MTIDEVEQHFKCISYACDELGISKPNGTKWKQQGYIPWGIQWRLFNLTDGKLKPDSDDPVHLRRRKIKDEARSL